MNSYTTSELEAYYLVNQGKSISTQDDVRQASDYILELAERIKNDKVSMLMEKKP